MLTRIVILFFLYLPFTAYANYEYLADHPTWHELIYFSHQRTEITTPTFYISGKDNLTPLNELKATITAMQKPEGTDKNSHAQCKFRARYYWLSKQEFWKKLNVPSISCPEYQEWSKEDEVTSVSIVLASGYLSNPASFFGHMLLKFNSKNASKKTALLDTSINYGAIIPPNENGLVYITKGLFGGYDAGFTSGTYYTEAHNYTNLDLRDVWEYQLNLTLDEVRFLQARSWELLKNKFTYFYLTKNCGYRIAELLELVLDHPLVNKNKPWIIPVEIFRNISEYKHEGVPLVKEVKHHLSKQSIFYNKLAQLNRQETYWLKKIIENISYIETQAYKILSVEAKIRIADALLDYYELVIIKDKDNTSHKESKRRMLQEMLILSSTASISSWDKPKVPAPHLSQKPSLIRFGGLYSDDKGAGTLIEMRPTYFDMLTPSIGIIPNAILEGLNIDFEVFEGGNARLSKLDIFNIASLGLPNSGLGDETPFAWNINFGWDRPDLTCNNCLTESLEGGLGKAFKPSENIAMYGYFQLRLQEDVAGYSNLANGLKTGILWEVSPLWKMQLTHEYKDYVGNSRNVANYFKFESRFGHSVDWDVRLRYEKQATEQVSLSVGMFF